MTLLATSSSLGAPPAWTILPFALYLLAIAVLPLVAAHYWEPNRNKFVLALLFSLPVVGWLFAGTDHGGHLLGETAKEYALFMALLGSLYVITGGIYIRGTLSGTPLGNTALLGIGACLASFIGTTGASMLLVRPLLRANRTRLRKTHLIVFFIFIVSNGGGLLTPLGDPPLFLGFLRGVPFAWTLQLWGEWALVNGALLVIFNVMDQVILAREEKERAGSQLEDIIAAARPITLEGSVNLLFLLGVVGINFACGAYGNRISSNPEVVQGVQFAGMIAMAVGARLTSTRLLRRANKFTWGPMIEVAVIFVGIFVTMVPAMKLLEARGASLGLTQPWQFFWASGALSSFLDNAPTYLSFSSLAVGVVNQADPAAGLSAGNLAGLQAHPYGGLLLKAISCGAVFMGANTYIGNGPNFMVKAIAEQQKVKMPSFFGYMAWSGAILIPLFLAVTLVFFR